MRCFRGSPTTLFATASLALVGCGGGEAGRAGADVVTLGEPTAAFPDDFGSIQTVREMPDGRLLVADPLGRALYMVDMDAGTRTVVGSEGSGPNEYLQPDAVWPLPGDSTLLVDLGNNRLVALGPDLQFGPTMPIAMGEPSLGGGMVLATPQGVDGQGRIYVRSRGGGMGLEPPDSGAIVRVERGSQTIDTVGTFGLRGQIRSTIEGGRGVSVSQIPLSPEDAWGVAADGSVAVARAGTYRVDWLSPDGATSVGSPIAHEPLPIGGPEQDEWFATRSRNPGLMVSVSMGGGSAQVSFQRGGGGRGSAEPDPSQYEWPDALPPVYPGRLPVDGLDRAWVRRHTGAGGPTRYDVFGRDGARIGTVELDADRQVIGFGDDAVYVVAYDEFDLNYLERYGMPAL